MRRDGLFVSLFLFLLVAALAGLATFGRGDEPVKTYRVVTPKDDEIIATGINGRGEIVGFEWFEEKDQPGVLSQRPILARGKEITELPVLEGYTATFPAALSDDGMVVGRSSKPAPPRTRVYMRNQGFVWDAKSGIHGLGTLPDDWASIACGVSRDGRRISGYSVGDDRVRACVWDRKDDGKGKDNGDGWKATALPQNARLGSNVVAISGDGRFVTASEGVMPCLWSRDDTGVWSRTVLAEKDPWLPRAVNDKGTVVGLRHGFDGTTHAVVWTRDAGTTTIKEPEGYIRSEASAINNAGAIVGMVDGPPASKIGPDAFVYENGRLRLLTEGGPNFAAATAINDRGEVAGVLEKRED